MPSKAFLDTNIFVYSLDDADPQKQRVANTLVRDALATGSACISYQVVQECLNVITRKSKKPLDSISAQRYLDLVLAPLMRVAPSTNLFHEGLVLQARYRFSFYDSMIVAAAYAAGCSKLYSEDMQDGQLVGQLLIVNPFK